MLWSMSNSISRRAFSRAAAGLLAGGGLAASLPAQPSLPQAAAPSPKSTDAEVDAKLARVLALYGDRLAPEQKQRLRRTIAGHVAMLAPVRAVALTNAAPPQTVLRLAHKDAAGKQQ